MCRSHRDSGNGDGWLETEIADWMVVRLTKKLKISKEKHFIQYVAIISVAFSSKSCFSELKSLLSI